MDALGDMIEPLAQAIPDEGTRYVTAINIIKKTHPVEALLSDFDRCLGAIEDSKQQFEGALERQLRQRVGAREATIKNNDERMETLNTQIAQLTRQLQTLQAERDEAQGSIAKERHQLDLTKQQYELAYREVRHGLEAQRAKVVQHGGV